MCGGAETGITRHRTRALTVHGKITKRTMSSSVDNFFLVWAQDDVQLGGGGLLSHMGDYCTINSAITGDTIIYTPTVRRCRGIDVVRHKIKMFAQRKVQLPPGRQKVVILDEADRCAL